MTFLDLKKSLVDSLCGPFSEYLAYKLAFSFLERKEQNQ